LADPEALEHLLAATDEKSSRARRAQLETQAAVGAYEPNARTAELIERWLGHVERYEGRALDRELAAAAADIGSLAFLDRLVGPFLRELGERWAQGRLGVGHEHFASERVRELLARQWRPLADAATGPVLVLATPAREQHVLGLHMAALALAANNARIVFLGANAPAAEIAAAVAHHGASAVVLSAALGIERKLLETELQALRAGLLDGVPIVAGGRGFEPGFEGVRVVGPLSELVAWLQAEA
jgi:methylmalonyl-CoA mutase cobalamin-binding subunit